jgi:hypothetical protein
VPTGDREDLVDRVDRAEPGRAGGGDDRADPAAGQQSVECVDVHRPVGEGRHRHGLDAEQVGHPGMGVVRVDAVRDRLARMDLPGDEQRLQVGDRAAAGEVPEVVGVSEHRRQLGDNILFHRGRRRSAVERVVVGVDQHRGDVADHRRRVRRLEHLGGVARVVERVVVAQPSAQLGGRHRQLREVDVLRRMRRDIAVLPHPRGHLGDRRPQLILQPGRVGGHRPEHGWAGILGHA